jgi:hypothetical protein
MAPNDDLRELTRPNLACRAKCFKYKKSLTDLSIELSSDYNLKMPWRRDCPLALARRLSSGGDMDHGRFEYSAIARRPRWELPHGARVAVWITPNVEHFHYDKPAMSMTPMTAGLRPDVLNYAWRDYGARRDLASDGNSGPAGFCGNRGAQF